MRALLAIAVLLAFTASDAFAAQRIRGFGGYPLYGEFTRAELRRMRQLPFIHAFSVPGATPGKQIAGYFAEGFSFQRPIRLPDEKRMPALVRQTVLDGSIVDIDVTVVFSRAAIGDMSHAERVRRTTAAYERLCGHAKRKYTGEELGADIIEKFEMDQKPVHVCSVRHPERYEEWIDIYCYPEQYKIRIDYMTAWSEAWQCSYSAEQQTGATED